MGTKATSTDNGNEAAFNFSNGAPSGVANITAPDSGNRKPTTAQQLVRKNVRLMIILCRIRLCAHNSTKARVSLRNTLATICCQLQSNDKQISKDYDCDIPCRIRKADKEVVENSRHRVAWGDPFAYDICLRAVAQCIRNWPGYRFQQGNHCGRACSRRQREHQYRP